MSYQFANKGFFDNFEAMCAAYYPEYAGMFSDKDDAPYLTTTTGIRQVMYAPGLMAQFVTAAMAIGALKDEAWQRSGKRLEIAPYFGTSPGGGQTEGTTTPASAQDTLDPISYTPKQIAPPPIEMSLVELSMEGKDNVATWAELLDARRKNVLNEQDQNLLKYGGQTAAGSNIETIDHIIASYDEYANAGESPASNIYDYEGKSRHTAASAYDAQVSHGGGTPRKMSLSLIDAITFGGNDGTTSIEGCIPYWNDQAIENKVYLTRNDTAGRVSQLIKTIMRGDVATAAVRFTVNGVQTIAGQKGPKFINMYNEMGVLVDKYVDAHYGASSTGLGKFYLMDLDHIAMWWSMPWQYQESQEVLATGKLGRKGIFLAVGNVTADMFKCHGKVQCIN